MTGDGANMGIDANQALKTILGGEPAPEGQQATREEVRRRLGNAPRLADLTSKFEDVVRDYGELHYEGPQQVLYHHGERLAGTYEGTADIAARAIIDFLEAFPEFDDSPIENEYDHDAMMRATGIDDMPKPLKLGLYEHMNANGYDLGVLGLTGFQWGFAYNLAKWLRFEDGGQNPAIIEVTT